jgi:hypothetical protein
MKASIHVHVCKYIKMFNFRSNQILFVYFYLTVWILYNLTKYIVNIKICAFDQNCGKSVGFFPGDFGFLHQ